MKKATFIAVRHGSYDNEDLSPEGEEQMKRLAQHVKELNDGKLPVTLICSTAPRASQGGKIIMEKLDIPAELAIFNECLWEDAYHKGSEEEARKLIDDNLHEDAILLALSHLDFVPFMARYVAEKFSHNVRFRNSSYGQGWLVSSEGCHKFPQ